jgi:predicted phage terminase large subunit-like protein
MKWPESRWLFSSYSGELSTDHSLKRRRIIKSPWFQERWGGSFKLADDQDRKTEFENDKKGKFTATSTRGTVGGKGGDFIVIDDPQNPEKSGSSAEREEAKRHIEYLLTRLDNPKQGRIVLIMQRLHFDDCTAHMEEIRNFLAKSGQDVASWARINLPIESKKKTFIHFPKSGKSRVREEDELLWPQRIGKDEVSILKNQLGSYQFSAQYNQMPSPDGGGIISRSWFQTYRDTPIIRKAGWFWDTAVKEKQMNDYSVGALIGVTDKAAYVLDIIRKKLIYPDLKAEVRNAFNKSIASFIMVEDKTSGQQLIQDFKRDSHIPVHSYEPKGDKVQRASMVSPIIEAGKLFVPDAAPWVYDYLDEFEQFPRGKHDDQVDATTMALNHFYLTKRAGSFKGLVDSPMELKQEMIDRKNRKFQW